MTLGKQCGRATSIWNRDIWTGQCRRCQLVPSKIGRKTSRRLLAITIIFALATAGSAVIYCTPILDDYFRNRPFSSDDWPFQSSPRLLPLTRTAYKNMLRAAPRPRSRALFTVLGLPKKALCRTTSGHPIGLADQRKPGW